MHYDLRGWKDKDNNLEGTGKEMKKAVTYKTTVDLTQKIRQPKQNFVSAVLFILSDDR